MIKVNGTTILLTRCDSAYIEFQLVDESNQPWQFDANTNIHMQVREIENDDMETSLLFEGNAETETDEQNIKHYYWHIVPANTQRSKPDASYVWDAQIEFANGDTYTFIESSKFKIKPEVTLREIKEVAPLDGETETVSDIKELTKTVITVEIPREA